MSWEIRDLNKLGKKTPIWISICREIKEQNLARKFDREERKFDKIYKN